jgi:hypothetical protein
MNNLSDLINFILTSSHSSMVDIPLDFMGDEQTTKTTINKLARLELIEIKHLYLRIQVTANIPHLEHLRDNYKYDLTLYENRNKVSINSLNVDGDIIGSQLGQGLGGNMLSKSNSTILDPARHRLQPNDDAKTIVKKETIWNKIYKWTDHKLISIIIFSILTFLMTLLLNYLNIIPCLNK